MERQLITVTSAETEECQKLLRLMGIPAITAPGEAEAECAMLVKAGRCYAMATEDMDSLAFGTNILLRHLNAGNQKKALLMEIRLTRVLEAMGLSHSEFVDLCILLGCDYCGTIRNRADIGP